MIQSTAARSGLSAASSSVASARTVLSRRRAAAKSSSRRSRITERDTWVSPCSTRNAPKADSKLRASSVRSRPSSRSSSGASVSRLAAVSDSERSSAAMMAFSSMATKRSSMTPLTTGTSAPTVPA